MKNVVNKFFLWLVLQPKSIYTKMGVDTSHLRAILIAKLIMDDRRPNTFQQTKRNRDGNVNMATLGTMMMSAALGLLYLFAFFVGNDFIVHITFYFTMFIFMLASALITDFTSVLIDVRDNYIILPKPVNDKTIVTARLIHILIHVSKLVLPMSLPGIVFMALKTSTLGAIVFAVQAILATLITMFLVNAVYIVILKITTPQKFQKVISTFQIVFAIAIYAGYQIVPRLIERSGLENYDISQNKWMWLVPPFWFAKAWFTLSEAVFTIPGLCAIALTLILPFVSLYVVIKYFAPSFNQKLSLISSSSAESSTATSSGKTMRSSTSGYVTAASALVCKEGAERMAFLLAWKLTSRSKDFKMKVYPTIGYMMVILVLPFFKNGFSLSRIEEHPEMLPFIFTGIIYFSSFILIMAINQLMYSDKYKAAWMYYTTPVVSPGEIISGAYKSAVVKFYAPIVIITFITAIAVAGTSIIPNLILAMLNEVLICSVLTYLTVKNLPFSMQQTNNMKTGNFFKVILTLAIPAVVMLMHFLVYKFLPVVYIFIVLSAIAVWLMNDSIRRVSWQKVIAANDF